jgi:hypothetical protein
MTVAEKASAQKFDFPKPGSAFTRSARPERIVIQAAILPMEKVPADVPTFIRRMPTMDLGAPSSAKLVYTAGAEPEFEIVKKKDDFEKLVRWLQEQQKRQGR